MHCAACKGPAHPASGCQYTAQTLVCGPCVREFWAWAVRHINGAGRRRGLAFYDHVRMAQADNVPRRRADLSGLGGQRYLPGTRRNG